MFSKTIFFSVLFIGLFVISSCKKVLDQLHPKKSCKIASITFLPDSTNESSNFYTREWTFNEAGEPIKSLVNVTTTGSPNSLFQYDEKGNLKYYIDYFKTEAPASPYDNKNFNIFSYHSYTSDEQGNIVIDTFFNQITLKPFTVVYYKYDHLNRMIEAKYTSAGTWDSRPYYDLKTFEYNDEGNQVGRVFDNKVNFKTSSKVLQFLTQDYNRNNPMAHLNQSISYTYNIYQLPIETQGGEILPYISHYSSTGKNTILYNCK